MSESSRSSRLERRAVLRYGLAVLSVAVAVLLTHPLADVMDTVPLFYASVIISSWYGGRWPGLLSVLLATLAVDYYFIVPFNKLNLTVADLPHLGAFAVLALIVSFLSIARQRAEGSLREARDELEAKVVERTADLKQINEELKTEIAERKRVEEILREQASLLDLTHDTVFVRNMTDVITYWNHGAQEQYGWTSEEALGQVSHEIIRTVEIRRNRISLRKELSDDVPLVLADRVQLQQVVLNLVMNAIEAMSGMTDVPRELTISSGTDEGSNVLVAVRDSGVGIGSESLDHLFDAFFTTKADGMGMGLAISRSIVQANGGRLWASQNAPKGAVFKFTLPSREAAP